MFQGVRLAASPLGAPIPKDFPAISWLKRHSLRVQNAVRANPFEKIPSPDGIFLQSDNFGLLSRQNEPAGWFEPMIAVSLKIFQFFGKLGFLVDEFLLFDDILLPQNRAVQMRV